MVTDATRSGDVLFSGGRVFTAGLARSERRDVLVRDGVIRGVGAPGSFDEVAAGIEGLERVDVGDGMLLPGFQDAHCHPVPAGIEMLQCDLSHAGSAAEALETVRRYAAGGADWVLGGGWTMDHFAGGSPTREALDAVTGDRPAYLVSRDHHSAWVNSSALARAGITAETPDPADGRIERRPDGSPAGTLHEGAMTVLDVVKPAPDAELAYRGLLAAQKHLHSLGITGWQDALVGDGLGFVDAFPVYLRAAEEGTLEARVTAALWWARDRGPEQLEHLIERRALAAASPTGPSGGFVADTVKMMLDGIVENQTAAIHGHYELPGVPHSGLDFIDPERLGEYVGLLDANGFSVHFHALGDRAVSQALDALGGTGANEALGGDSQPGRASALPTSRRHQLAHLQLVADADLERFARLGAIANLQAYWAYLDEQLRVLSLPVLPPGSVDHTYPFGRIAHAGARLAFGSDWPVSTADPLAAVHVAVNRTDPDEPGASPLGRADDRLGLAEALAGYTAGSAEAGAHGALTGRLEPGRLADLALLDRDPFEHPLDRIAETRVVGTWVGGRRVF